MSSICQNDPENASALIVGRTEEWAPGFLDCHRHVRHQLIYATHGVIHITTATHAWVLPPTRALWIKAGTAHSLKIKKPAEVKILYIDNKVPSLQNCLSCVVVNVTALVRELILACADLPWDYSVDSASFRLAQVLLDQLEVLECTPVALPMPSDTRALKIIEILSKFPSNREPLSKLAHRVGASSRTIERIFISETHLTFNSWRRRQRLLNAIERLAYGESVTNISMEIGYNSVSSFGEAFRKFFGQTPYRYFKNHS